MFDYFEAEHSGPAELFTENYFNAPFPAESYFNRPAPQPGSNEANYGSLSFAHSVKQANERGQLMLFPECDELFIDIDSTGDYQFFLSQVGRLIDNGELCTFTETPSRSGGGRKHVTVKFNRDLTQLERVAYQAALGSDRVHELLSLIRIRIGNPQPTVFFENKSNGL